MTDTLNRLPLIGDKAPAFKALTTTGTIHFPEDYAGKWVLFFSHPSDFTPVCTTEFMTLASMKDEFAELNVELLGQGFTWLDTGTHESLVEATNFVMTVEKHQHRKIACLEDIAYMNGWITREDVLETYEVMKKNQYGQYLKDVIDGKYVDAKR